LLLTSYLPHEDHALMVLAVASALYVPRPVASTGPLVVRYSASPIQLWDVQTRQKVATSLLLMTGTHPSGILWGVRHAIIRVRYILM